MIMIMTPRVVVTLGVATIFIVVNRLFVPILMVAFPAMEVCQTVSRHWQPRVTGAQIVILGTDEADVLGAIPYIAIRDTYSHSDRRRGWSGDDHGGRRWRRHDNHGWGRNGCYGGQAQDGRNAGYFLFRSYCFHR
jgi:hypothetical protein